MIIVNRPFFVFVTRTIFCFCEFFVWHRFPGPPGTRRDLLGPAGTPQKHFCKSTQLRYLRWFDVFVCFCEFFVGHLFRDLPGPPHNKKNKELANNSELLFANSLFLCNLYIIFFSFVSFVAVFDKPRSCAKPSHELAGIFLVTRLARSLRQGCHAPRTLSCSCSWRDQHPFGTRVSSVLGETLICSWLDQHRFRYWT